MTNKQIKVGDAVSWVDVPDGALVRRAREEGGVFFYQRRGDRGWCVGGRTTEGDGYFEQMDDDGWPRPWAHNDRGRVTIVALGLSGRESADDLRRLAEVFEVREALVVDALDQTVGVFLKDDGDRDLVVDHAWGARATPEIGGGFIFDTEALLTRAAERLHVVGWRPGMTAEDAARLLSGRA